MGSKYTQHPKSITCYPKAYYYVTYDTAIHTASRRSLYRTIELGLR